MTGFLALNLLFVSFLVFIIWLDFVNMLWTMKLIKIELKKVFETPLNPLVQWLPTTAQASAPQKSSVFNFSCYYIDKCF